MVFDRRKKLLIWMLDDGAAPGPGPEPGWEVWLEPASLSLDSHGQGYGYVTLNYSAPFDPAEADSITWSTSDADLLAVNKEDDVTCYVGLQPVPSGEYSADVICEVQFQGETKTLTCPVSIVY